MRYALTKEMTLVLGDKSHVVDVEVRYVLDDPAGGTPFIISTSIVRGGDRHPAAWLDAFVDADAGLRAEMLENASSVIASAA